MKHSATLTRKPAVRRRNYRLLSLLALVLLTLALALPATVSAFISTGDGGWFLQNPWTRSNSLNAVAFPDAIQGWAVGFDYDGITNTHTGVILATANGGVTWTAQTSGTTANLNAVAFPDATHGWAVGGDLDEATGIITGAILSTNDGGATWKEQSWGSDVFLHAVSFPDATHGWAVGISYDAKVPNVIVATTDGGATWSAQSSGSDATLTAVAFSDATHGWAVGGHSSGSDAHLGAGTCGDPTHGWAVDGPAPGDILATTDGGATWSAQKSESGDHLSDYLYGVAFPDASHGWAVGYGGVILATTTGGFPTGPTVAAPTFTAAGTVFVDSLVVSIACATPGATVRYTTDGSDPTASSAQYTGPLPLTTTTDLAARAFKDGYTESAVTRTKYYRDRDGDALPDEWETAGVDADGDGAIDVDLPAMGADPDRKDIFVEIDWMVEAPTENIFGWKVGGHSHEPKAEALKKVTDAFKAQGIALHIDAGPGSVMDPYHPERKWGVYSEAGDASAAGPMNEVKNLIGNEGFAAIQERNFQRGGVFHYCVFGHGFNSGISTGTAPIHGAWLLVADGMLNDGNACVTEQAGTFMHELGHSLGLEEGGGDVIKYKPNYLSVMNYSFQLWGLMDGDGKFGAIDYSREKLKTLDEASLNEGDGIGLQSAAGDLGTVYWRDGRGGNLISPKDPIRVSSPFGPINWNGLWGDTEIGIEEDLNTGKDEARVVPDEKLTGWDDWANLDLGGGWGGLIGPAAFATASRSARQGRGSADELSVGLPYEEFVASGLVLRDYRVAVTAEGGNVVMATPGAGGISLSLKVTNEGLEPDAYSLQAWGLGGASLGDVPASVQLAAGASETVSGPLALPAGTADGLVGSVRLLATSTGSPEISDGVEVAVYYESHGILSGAVTAKGSPLAGAAVTVSGCASVVTTADGAYSVADVAPGAYTVTYAKAGYVSRTRSVTFSAGTTTKANMALAASAAGAKVTLKLSGLAAGAVSLGQTVTASGTVTPVSLIGSRVTLTVQMKKGVTWIKVKTTSASSRPAGNYRWKYTPAVNGAYRMRAQVAKTAAYPAATTPWRAFTVK